MDDRLKLKGSITAFLSLSLLLILALIGTVIETARVGVAKTYIDRALTQALDTMFTEYNQELWKDYHLFALQEEADIEVSNTLKEQMEYTFFPNKDLKIAERNISNLNLFSIKNGNLDIERKTKLNEYDGEIFIHQAIEYMKYKTGEKLIKDFLEKLHLIQSFQKTVEVVKVKLETEESLGILNQDMMKFMEHIEGIHFGKTGIQFTRDGRIKTNSNFVKRYVTTEISKEGVNISHDKVWNVLKNSYIPIISVLRNINSNAKEVIDHIKQLEKLEEQLKQLYSIDTSDMEEDAKQALAQETQVLYQEQKKVKTEVKANLKNIKENKKLLLSSYSSIKNEVEKSLEVIPILQKKQKTIGEKVKSYESQLKQNKGEMIADLVEGFEKDLEEMKSYVGTETNQDGSISVISSMIQMKPLLEENKEILIQLEELKKLSIKENSIDMEEVISVTENLINQVTKYHTKELSFDYSNLVIKADRENPMEKLTSLLTNGLLDLVVKEPDKISLKKKTKNLTKEEYFLPGENLEKGLSKAPEEGYSREITDVFEEYSDNIDYNSFFSETINKIAEKLLFIEYILEHFRDYSTDYNEQTNPLKTALDYEKEYFVAGKTVDKENLGKVITGIITIRTILNYIYLLSDREKGKETYATAVALVGFTGLEPLVRLTQQLILITWGFEEALVDTAALLQGKKIPFVKTKASLSISYKELLSISRKLIQEKASQISENQEGICLDYLDYLRVFLMLKEEKNLSGSAMDLIEENFCMRYWDEFSIQKCIFGLKVKGEFYIPSKFIHLPFVQKLLGKNRGNWKVELLQEHAY